jgi:hypothetical protein
MNPETRTPPTVKETVFAGRTAWKITENGKTRVVILSPKSAAAIDKAAIRFDGAMQRLAAVDAAKPGP